MPNINIYIGSDYRALKAKKSLLPYLTSCHDFINIIDKGGDSEERDDYNDYAIAVAKEVKENPGSFGVLICSSAHGMTIQANRFKGIRAADCASEESARLAREHDNANILCLSADLIPEEDQKKIIYAFFHTHYTPEPRRDARIKKLDEETE